MKDILILWMTITLAVFSGCDSSDFNPKPSGYNTCSISPIIKDENNITYIPKYEPYSQKATLYTIEGGSFVKNNLLIKDIVSIANLGQTKRGAINIDNILYTIRTKSSDDFNYKESYTLSKIEMTDKGESVGIKAFVDKYYSAKINLDKIMSDISKVTEQHTYLLPISIYPDGLYIVYPSKVNVKFNRGANPGYLGYKVSYYRYYPADNPQNYIDVKIPCKASVY